VILYVQVGDLQASLQRARQLGGQVLMEAVDLPGGPTIAAISDPEGNTIGLVQQ
jgi:predicted enzyme related to lactoylglutathione lyase